MGELLERKSDALQNREEIYNKRMKKSPFASDKFRKSRGGYSRLLLLSCEKCKTPLMMYQKDGPGILKRLYVYRIKTPENFKNKKKLECKNCKTLLGVFVVYQKENRPAYRLFSGAIEKKVVKGDVIKRQ